MLFRSFSVLARILRFVGTNTDCTLFRYSSGHVFGTRTDSTFSRYSPGFHHFSVLTLIVLSFDIRPDSFSVLTMDSTFLVLVWTVFGTPTNSTFSWYSPRFYHFAVLTLIVPSSDTRPTSFSLLARILPFHGTHSDSTIFGY